MRRTIQGLPQGGAQETEAERCMEARLGDREGQRTPEKEVAAYWMTLGLLSEELLCFRNKAGAGLA